MWLENRYVENKLFLLYLLCLTVHKTMAALSLQQQIPIKQECSTILCYDGFALCIWESSKFLDPTTRDLKEASFQGDQQDKITFSKQQQVTNTYIMCAQTYPWNRSSSSFFFRLLKVALPRVIFSGLTCISSIFLRQETSLQGLSSTCTTL